MQVHLVRSDTTVGGPREPPVLPCLMTGDCSARRPKSRSRVGPTGRGRPGSWLAASAAHLACSLAHCSGVNVFWCQYLHDEGDGEGG